MVNTQLLISSLLTGIAVIMALTFHEFSHGYVSYLLGDSTAKQSGRLTLNPLKHLDLIGAICLFVFKFGWAKPVPINPDQYKHFKLGTVLTSLAGPFSNILFAFVALLVYGILITFTDLKDCLLYTSSASHLEGYRNVAVIGGGLGTAIAYPQAKKLAQLGSCVDIIVGFRNKDMIILEDEIKACLLYTSRCV